MSARYGNERVKKGIQHFFLGKGISAVGGFLAMLLVVRSLTISDFASYSILVALVEVFTAIAGFGLTHLILRYVPELYSKYQTEILRKLIIFVLFFRTFLLLILLAIGWLFSERISGWIGLNNAVHAFEIFLAVVAFRSTSHFLSQILESTLHQGIAQSAFSTTALIKFFGLWWMIHSNHSIGLVDVVIVEVICDAMACLILFIGILHTLWEKRPENFNHDDKIGWRSNKQMIRFAMTAYLQHLATLPFGGNTNRLLGGAMFGEKVMASFGFAQTLYEFSKRYLPTQLLIGLIRPIVVARYTSTKNFEVAASLCEKSLQFNFALLSGLLAVLLVSGTEILSFISKGKYGSESLILLSLLIVFLGLETQRLILEVLAQTVERYDIMIPSNIFLSVSVVAGVAGYQVLGASAFPIANAIALIMSNIWVIRRLSILGYNYQHDWNGTTSSIIILIVSAFLGLAAKFLDVHWIASTVITLIVYSALFLKMKLKFSVIFVQELIGRKL